MIEPISVIVPIYNSEKWIRECCESVLSQSYDNIELILVNDGSSDSSGEIIDKIALSDERVKVINIEHSGVSVARNAGLDVSAGKYVAFLDCDDTLQSDALDSMYSILKESKADVAVCSKAEFSSDGYRAVREFPLPYEVWQDTDGLKALLEDHPATYSVWGKLYKKELIDDIRFAVGRQAHEDSFFVFECMLKRPTVVVTNTVAVNYRLHDDSLSHRNNMDKIDDIIYLAHEKKLAVESLFPEYSNIAENAIVKANMSALGLLLRMRGKAVKIREREIIKTITALKQYYIPVSKKERKFFFVVRYHLYFGFKFFFGLFRKIKRGLVK